MKSRLTWLLYCVFTFLNVLVIDVKILGINIRYLIFAILVLIPFTLNKFLFRSDLELGKKIMLIAILLILYSSIFWSNDFSNISWFILPYFTFLLIPVFNVLYANYGPKKVLKVFVFAVYVLSAYFILLGISLLFFPSFAFGLAQSHDMVNIGIMENGLPRIFFKSCIFFIPVIVYQIIYSRNYFFKTVTISLFLIQIFLFFTYGLFIGVFTVVVLCLIYKRRKILALALICCTSILVVYSLGSRDLYLSKSKLYSFDAKISQLTNGFKFESWETFLFGHGIGAKIPDLDQRKLKDDFVIEVAPVMLYYVGGILFSALILFIYFWYALRGLVRSYRYFDDDLAFLSISHVGIVFASFSNPFVWSGGVGILFISMIVPIVHSKRSFIN